MYIEIVEDRKKWTLAVAIDPTQGFAIHFAATFPESMSASCVERSFRVFVKQGVHSQITQGPGHFTVVASVEVKAGEFSSVKRSQEGIRRRVEIILEMNKAPAQSHIAREKRTVGGESSGAVANRTFFTRDVGLGRGF